MGYIEVAPGTFLNTKFCISLWTVRNQAGITRIWISMSDGDAVELPTSYTDAESKVLQRDIQAILTSW